MSNPENKVINIQEFYGGRSSDAAIGPPASFSYDRALEFRRNPSQLTVLPGPRRIGKGVINDLVLNIVQALDGKRYAFGEQGHIYKIDTDNVVTHLAKLESGCDGLLYRSDLDAMYAATDTKLVRLYPMSGTPVVDVTLGPSRSTDTRAYRTGGTATYSVPIAIDEGQQCSFQSDIEPFYSVKVRVTDKGTGDWTLTLHDGLNNTLSTKTIAAADMSNDLVEFVLPTQVRALVKPNARTYHFHLTSTIADGKVACSTDGDLDTADFELWADRLVDTVNGLHPMAQFQQFTLIGNGNNLAVWEPLSEDDPPNNEFQRHRLVFPAGFEVCAIATTDEFAVIGCGKYSTDGTKDFQEGKIYLWDGTAQTYNQIVDIAAGTPEAITTFENYPYFIVAGALCAWPGGKNIIKIQQIASTDTAYRDAIDNTRVYPNMMCVRDNLLHLGFPSSTTSVDIEHGVYTWGALEKNYPASFGYGYVISTQTNKNTAGTMQLGCVRNFGDEMYLSWKDGDEYGLDIVDSYCDPAPVAKFRARRFDAGAAYKTKRALHTAVDVAALPEGVTLTPVHQIDNAAEISHLDITEGDTRAVASFEQPDFKRIVYGFDITCDGAIESPVIYNQTLEWNPLIERKAI